MSPKKRRTGGGQKCPLSREEQRGTKMSPKKRISSMVTTAVKDGDDYTLNGRKCFISGAPLARTDPA